MKVIVLGSSAATDASGCTSGYLVLADSTVLLDCGFGLPARLWQHSADPDLLDIIYISHTHADHWFGLPAVLVRMFEDKRTSPLTILCPRGTEDDVRGLIELGYKGIADRFEFPLDVVGVGEDDSLNCGGLSWCFAPTLHPVRNLAVRVSEVGASVCYSGDGGTTGKSEALYGGTDLLIHEAYTLNSRIEGHANAEDVIRVVRRAGAEAVALTHVKGGFDKAAFEEFCANASSDEMSVALAEPGGMFTPGERRMTTLGQF